MLDTAESSCQHATLFVETELRSGGVVLAYEGKAKRVTPRADGSVALHFKDDATAFNGKKHALFDGKGELNSKITELLFEWLETQGVRTQHLGRLDERTLHGTSVTIVPLEVVVRFRVAGSLEKRTGLPYGQRCTPPVIELYYKRDDLGDPLLCPDHVRLLAIADDALQEELRLQGAKIAVLLEAFFSEAGLELFDIKFEFGHSSDGTLLLADEISPDTCRLRDAKTGAIMDKDRFRKDEGDLMEGYREVYARLEGVPKREKV